MTKYQQLQETLIGNQRKWLVTGAAGFIGSNLVEKLLLLDQKVIGLDNFSNGHKKNLAYIKAIVGGEKFENLEFIEGDVRNFETCLSASKGMDYVLHQAALGSVPRSIKNPIASHESNVTGTLNTLAAAHENRVKKVVFASSSSVYGDNSDLPKVEDVVGKPLSPYAVTKKCKELYARIFFDTYNLPVIGLRYFNVFGKHQSPQGPYAAVIPRWVQDLIDKKEVYIFGDGETSRDFTFVENAIQANLLCACSENEEANGKILNAACGATTSLKTLFSLIRDGLARHFDYVKDIEPIYADFREGDIRHSFADISQLKRLVGYEPTHTVSQGVEKALDWYKAYLS